MSRLRQTKIVTPGNDRAASQADVHYNNTLVPAWPSWIDENNLLRRLSQPPICKLTADGGNRTTATLTDETGLVFALKNGTYYRFTFHLIYTTTVTTSGLKWGLTTPAVTHFAALGRTLVAADGPAASFDGLVNTSGDSIVATDAQAITADQLAIIEGTILPSADGNLQVQTANEAAAGTVVTKQGSNGMLWELV